MRGIASWFAVLLSVCLFAWGAPWRAEETPGWHSLFDGESFEGWKVNENPDTFSIKDGAIVAAGPRSHLFYVGPVQNGRFKNFELKVEVMTKPNSNGGIFFHTGFQDAGWPSRGYEVQVNNSFPPDYRRTGSLYGVVDIREAPAQDNVWFTEHIIVCGRRVLIKVDGKTQVDWTEPADLKLRDGQQGRRLSAGTFALQGHDPGSMVLYRNIRVKPLPDDAKCEEVVQ